MFNQAVKWYLIQAVALITSSVAQVCTSGGRSGIRLQDGRNRYEGRVEVCDEGEWKTVCSRGWGREEAAVICRQLGFSGNLNPIEERNSSHFGQGSGEILRKEWHCEGSEENLLDCPTEDNSRSTECSHNRDAGVYCFGKNPAVCSSSSESNIRLVGGSSGGRSGRVEICLYGLWGTVCDDGWNINDATVVCRQLGFTISYGIPTSKAYFGEGQGPIHLTFARCHSRDTQLTECSADLSGVNDCSHREDAGVICQGSSNCIDSDVRLSGGRDEREGRVEICYNGVWGTVCDTGWDEVDANVVCNQLGYGTPATPVHNSGAGDGPILFTQVSCTNNNSQLSQCVHIQSIGQHNCDYGRSTAGVICPKDTQVGTTTTAAFVSSNTEKGKAQPVAIIGGSTSAGVLFIIAVILTVGIIAFVLRRRKATTLTTKRNNSNIYFIVPCTYFNFNIQKHLLAEMVLDQPCPSASGGEIILAEHVVRCREQEIRKELESSSADYYNSLCERRKGAPIEVFMDYENVTVEDKNDRVYEPMQNYYASLSKKTMQTELPQVILAKYESINPLTRSQVAHEPHQAHEYSPSHYTSLCQNSMTVDDPRRYETIAAKGVPSPKYQPGKS